MTSTESTSTSGNMENSLAKAYASLGWPTSPLYLPVVYSEYYNIHFWGIEKLHPFDSCKFRKIFAALVLEGLLDKGKVATACEVDEATLLDVHTPEYLKGLHSSPAKVAQVVELAALRLLPNSILQSMLMAKMRRHVGGTMLALGLAAARGWAINIGGGLHHAFYDGGMGWCPYSDITLAIRRVRAASNGAVDRVMIVDTDAHQGNGHERNKLHFRDRSTFIVDLYNADVFPWDHAAKAGIDVDVPLQSGCNDAEYLARLDEALDAAFLRFKPDMVIHNAGSDILAGDTLGRMNVSASAVVERDLRVWQRCRSQQVPVCMLLSGGYARESASVVTQSLKRILQAESATAAP